MTDDDCNQLISPTKKTRVFIDLLPPTEQAIQAQEKGGGGEGGFSHNSSTWLMVPNSIFPAK